MNSELRRAPRRAARPRARAVSLPPPDRDAGPDERAHHAAAEGVGLQPGDEHAVGRRAPRSNACSSRIVVAPARGLQKRREVVQAEQRLRGVVHRVDVERGRDARACAAAGADPAPPRRPRCGTRSAARTPRSARRTRRGELRRATLTSDSSPAMPLSRRARALGPARTGRPPRSGRFRMRSCASVRSTCATWPVACTPTSVRPATVSVRRIAGAAEDVASAVLELALHGAQPRLTRPPGERGAVVGDVETDAPRGRRSTSLGLAAVHAPSLGWTAESAEMSSITREATADASTTTSEAASRGSKARTKNGQEERQEEAHPRRSA